MPRFVKESGGREVVIETSLPREAAQLRAEGFKEQAARTKVVRAADAEAAKTAEAPKSSK